MVVQIIESQYCYCHVLASINRTTAPAWIVTQRCTGSSCYRGSDEAVNPF